MSPIVFLHIPKTAGQTVHNELARLVGGPQYVSPVRVTDQAVQGRQMPDGYRLYSGHIDWTEIDKLPKQRFVFTILRAPRERIASFYLYMRQLAEACTHEELEHPANFGKRMALNLTADDYFFGGTDDWKSFVRSMYDNFYCSYFATRRMSGWSALTHMHPEERVSRAYTGLTLLDAVYSIDQLALLERDVESQFGRPIHVANNFFNTGGHEKNELRWTKLCTRFEKDATATRLKDFARLDETLMKKQILTSQPSLMSVR